MKPDLKNTLYTTLILLCLVPTAIWIGYTIAHSTPEDFRVFYGSASTALHGDSIYRTYGPIELPYWYFPWLAWFYIPLALFSQPTAYIIYITISILCALIAIYYLAGVFIPDANIMERLFIFGMTLSLCWLLFRVGQMDFILLAITVVMIHLINKGKPNLAGLMVPILLFKPHLYIQFLPFALFKGKKGFLIGSTVICLFLIAISFLIIPNWPHQMLQMLARSGKRTDNNWNFTTLPNMLGMQENWSGTANIPLTIVLILIAFMVLWRFRALDTFPFLALALAGSLFCAPRAYTYNFPLLIPAMIWVSADLSKPLRLIFWVAAGTIPFLFRFSTGTYSIVLAIFLFGIYKANRTLASESSHPKITNPD